MFPRTARLNTLLKEEISKVFLKEGFFSRDILVTVTRIDTPLDLCEAKAYISVFPEEKQGEVMTELNKNIYYIQGQINKALYLKKVPKIIFYNEEKVKQAGRIEELLEQVHKKEK